MDILNTYGGYIIIAALMVPYFIYVYLSERSLRRRHEQIRKG